MNKLGAAATVAMVGILVVCSTGAASASPPPANPWPAWLDPIILFIGKLLGLPPGIFPISA